MIRPGPEKHGVWPNLSLDNALLILGETAMTSRQKKEGPASAGPFHALAPFCGAAFAYNAPRGASLVGQPIPLNGGGCHDGLSNCSGRMRHNRGGGGNHRAIPQQQVNCI